MNDKIKVLHIADKFGVRGSSVHGVSRLFSWWFPQFDKDRFEVDLIGLRHKSSASINLEKKGIGILNLGRKKYDPLTGIDIYKEVVSRKADIIHLHGYGSSNFGRLASILSECKVIVHEHFVDPAVPSYQRLADYVLRKHVDYGVAVSESVKEFMVKDRYIPENKVEVIYNGAPLNDFRPKNQTSIEKEKEKWGIPEDFSVVGTVGRLDRQKGIRFLIDAAADIKEKFKRVKFMVVGDGPLIDELRERAHSSKVDQDIIFTGYQSDVAQVQSVFDVQVFPSLWEGTPLTLFEAMSMKMPIVSTPVDGLGEVLRHGENALLVPPKNSDKLAQAILRLLSNPNISHELKTQAHRDSQRFDIINTVNKIQDLYIKILDSN